MLESLTTAALLLDARQTVERAWRAQLRETAAAHADSACMLVNLSPNKPSAWNFNNTAIDNQLVHDANRHCRLHKSTYNENGVMLYNGDSATAARRWLQLFRDGSATYYCAFEQDHQTTQDEKTPLYNERVGAELAHLVLLLSTACDLVENDTDFTLRCGLLNVRGRMIHACGKKNMRRLSQADQIVLPAQEIVLPQTTLTYDALAPIFVILEHAAGFGYVRSWVINALKEHDLEIDPLDY